VLVPAVETSLSTRRVLVTDWVHAEGFAAMKGLPDAERDRLGETIFRFFFATAREHGLALGDPHPGNLLHAPTGASSRSTSGWCARCPPATPSARRRSTAP
jgi:predicted unusual protein kinase regulating ubiquinone biosynthesis (AarF/ABC1/UbiB family)